METLREKPRTGISSEEIYASGRRYSRQNTFSDTGFDNSTKQNQQLNGSKLHIPADNQAGASKSQPEHHQQALAGENRGAAGLHGVEIQKGPAVWNTKGRGSGEAGDGAGTTGKRGECTYV